jgi:hypothetical protein
MSTTKPVGALSNEIPVWCSAHARQHLGLLYHHEESSDTLFVHATQELVHVGKTPLKDIPKRRADLRGQPFEIQTLQDRTQMLFTTRYETVPFQQVPCYNLQFARWN